MKKLFKILADLKLAIFLLSLIIFFSIIGSIIEQDKAIDYYKLNYPLTNSLFNYKIILFFGINHLFKTSWFVLLLMIFGSSLLICTYIQQLPSLDFSRSLTFLNKLKKNQRFDLNKQVSNKYLNNILFSIQKENYFLFQNKNSFFAYKGIIGRIGPIIVHLSIILILIGSILGALTGFTAQELVPKSEIFYIQNMTDSGGLNFLPQIPARINDFWINYNIKGLISQFYSNLSILNTAGTEIKNLTISVNKPLDIYNIVWYQTDWDLLALRAKINNTIYEFPLTQISNTNQKMWISWIPNNLNSDQGSLFLIDNLKGIFLKYNELGEFDKFVEIGENINITSNFNILFLEIITATGLQIKLDPGIIYIYLGFAFLILSTLFSYFSYSRIWILKTDKDLKISGSTNRAKFQFEIQFLKFLKQN
jgi:cytochrome c biogenesis protein